MKECSLETWVWSPPASPVSASIPLTAVMWLLSVTASSVLAVWCPLLPSLALGVCFFSSNSPHADKASQTPQSSYQAHPFHPFGPDSCLPHPSLWSSSQNLSFAFCDAVTVQPFICPLAISAGRSLSNGPRKCWEDHRSFDPISSSSWLQENLPAKPQVTTALMSTLHPSPIIRFLQMQVWVSLAGPMSLPTLAQLSSFFFLITAGITTVLLWLGLIPAVQVSSRPLQMSLCPKEVYISQADLEWQLYSPSSPSTLNLLLRL